MLNFSDPTLWTDITLVEEPQVEVVNEVMMEVASSDEDQSQNDLGSLTC